MSIKNCSEVNENPYVGAAMVELLIQNGADVNAQGADGETPLHVAIGAENEKIAEVLIKNGADLNAKDRSGRTPLHLATEQSSIKMVELLAKNGADLNAKDRKGRTPLHVASQCNESILLNFLYRLSIVTDMFSISTREC